MQITDKQKNIIFGISLLLLVSLLIVTIFLSLKCNEGFEDKPIALAKPKVACNYQRCNSTMRDIIVNKNGMFTDSGRLIPDCHGCPSKWYAGNFYGGNFQTSQDGKTWKNNSDRNAAYQDVMVNPPIDCKVSNWNDWGPCTKECGEGGTQTRNRTIITQPKYNGKKCPTELIQTQNCNERRCLPEPLFWRTANTYGLKPGYRLQDIPLTKYPMIGSHDSATGSSEAGPDINLPLVKTQSLNFLEQYEKGGVTFFDVRCTYTKNNENKLLFCHGPINLQFAKEDRSLENLIRKVINNQDFIIIYMVHERDRGFFSDNYDKILMLWKDYLGNFLKVDSNCEFITNETQINKSVNYYKNLKKYVLLLHKDLVNTNYDENQKCFKGYDASDTDCRSTTCIGRGFKGWKELYDYIDQRYTTYINDVPVNKLTVIQTMFQAPNDASDILKAMWCVKTDTAVQVEQTAFVNSKMYKYFIKKKYTPNILLFDNVNECSKAIMYQLILNFTDPDVPRKSECSFTGKVNDTCTVHKDCENDSCGRYGSDPKICCPVDTTYHKWGYDYCTNLENNTRCKWDKQCKSGNCSGNVSGLSEGVCR